MSGIKKNAAAFVSETCRGRLFTMLSPKAQLSLRNAKEYFREHLDVGDYYAEGQKVKGEWFGLGAEKLGLKGVVKETEFLALCEGLYPMTGEQLTARKNSTRRDADGRTVANRRVFYDFTISPPKSVSVVALMQDERILGLHNEAVKRAMVELEKFAETRVRKAGQRSDRMTGNVVVAAFQHDTSRELDPHLHTHCVVLNATFDPVENRWKALEVLGMKSNPTLSILKSRMFRPMSSCCFPNGISKSVRKPKSGLSAKGCGATSKTCANRSPVMSASGR